MAMSWVALHSATMRETTLMNASASPGGQRPSAAMERIKPICVASIQPRRRPSTGTAYRSSTGDQRNLNE